MLKNILCLILFCIISMPGFTDNPDPKYCAMLKKLQPNMAIGDVFLIMGPPHTFGQPPNLDVDALANQKQIMQPQNSVSPDTPATRERILKSMANDPILGAFMNAPSDYKNVLIWTFENDALSVAVQVKGTTVTNVKANFSCK